MHRPPRTIDHVTERRLRCEADVDWFDSLGIRSDEVVMLLQVVRDVQEFRPYGDAGPLRSKWQRAGARQANGHARRTVLSRLLDRVDGRRIEDSSVMEDQPDFAPGLTRHARMDRLFYAMLAVDEING